ncbi:MAG: Crp/Fnr family transcriptional regulator [Armatimonadota bacterium]
MSPPEGMGVMASDPLALLRRVPLFKDVSDDVLIGLAPQLRRRAYRKGTMIFHKDQAGDALYIIESGRVRIFLPAEGGDELTIDLLASGDVFGDMALLDDRPRSASADALEDTVTYTLGRDEFQRYLAETPRLASALLQLLSVRQRDLIEYTETLAFLDVHARIAKVLLDLANRYGTKIAEGIEIDIDLTQADLARMVGATRERVNRALASFRAQGVLELRGKKIVILDAERLRKRIY